MLCSISTSKSGSSWLERLRSNKGFPSGDDLDLGNFLTNPNSSDSPVANASDSPDSISESAPLDCNPAGNSKSVAGETPSETGDKEWLGVMSNVLSELFNMGDPTRSSRIPVKKSGRKQKNPRICINPSSSNGDNSAEEKSSSDCATKGDNFLATAGALNSGEIQKDIKDESDNNVEAGDVQEEQEKGEKEFVGFSKSEVTVIDTSCEVWKFDKLLFRRKNIWKVMDKKGRSRVFGRKKRKGSKFDGNADCNKKQNISSSELSDSMSKDAQGGECDLSTHVENHKDDMMEQGYVATPSNLNHVPRKRLSRKSRKRRSSVVLIKTLPSS